MAQDLNTFKINGINYDFEMTIDTFSNIMRKTEKLTHTSILNKEFHLFPNSFKSGHAPQ